MSLIKQAMLSCVLMGSLSLVLTHELKAELPEPGIYVNSESTPIYDLIDGAKTSLDISVYQMNDAQVTLKLRNAIQRGVKVRIVKEPRPEGDPCHLFEEVRKKEEVTCTRQRELYEEIVSSGGTVIPFSKSELCPNPQDSCVLHGKMMIADQKIVLLSTGNFNSTSLCNLAENPEKCDRDYTVILRDSEVIQALSVIFSSDLLQTKYDLKAILRGPIQKKITVSPYSRQPLIELIQSAKTSVRVENQYLKEPFLNQALREAAQRGVKVEVMTASACSFRSPSRRDRQVIQNIYSQFDEVGIQSRMFSSKIRLNGKPGYLHAKAIVIDDSIAWVGSVNGSVAATSNNREFGVFITEPAWVNSLVKVMKKDFASEGAESWNESLLCKKENELPTTNLSVLNPARTNAAQF